MDRSCAREGDRPRTRWRAESSAITSARRWWRSWISLQRRCRPTSASVARLVRLSLGAVRRASLQQFAHAGEKGARARVRRKRAENAQGLRARHHDACREAVKIHSPPLELSQEFLEASL